MTSDQLYLIVKLISILNQMTALFYTTAEMYTYYTQTNPRE